MTRIFLKADADLADFFPEQTRITRIARIFLKADHADCADSVEVGQLPPSAIRVCS